MIFKYFPGALAFIVGLLLFSSCLKSSGSDTEFPTDPQIYAISLSSKTDTTGLLPNVVFTIDQINGKIFNRKPMPYGFNVDSVALSLTPSSGWSFSKIEIILTDSTYSWNMSDSIAINRLRKIKTWAPDWVTSKSYDFELKIYQEDPYILKWEKIEGNYLTSPVASQRTIAYKDRFYTYYLSGNEVKAVSAAISGSPQWSPAAFTGIPHTLLLSSLATSGDIIYALDAPPTGTGSVYLSRNGSEWVSVSTTPYKVEAIYGELPFATPGNILLAVSHDGKSKFARANSDFTDIVLMNDIPSGIPVTGFSSIKVESGSSYAGKFIFLSGGTTAAGMPNNDIWLLQDNEEEIKYIAAGRPAEGILEGSSLFFYDEKPYLVALSSGKNILMYSENNGLEWVMADENQSLPEGFAARKNSSVITDADNNIWIFGGVSASGAQLVEIWRGKLNKFAPD